LIACSNDGTIRSFDSVTGKLLWFKKFNEKMRCLSWIRRKKGDFILCGGDDKQIHIINKNSQKIVKNISLSNYVWNSIHHFEKPINRAIFSTYSFQQFLDSKNADEIDFKSEIIAIDSKGERAWMKKGINAEDLKILRINKNNILLVGDSRGNCSLLDLKTGKDILQIQYKSPLNVISILENSSMLILGYENGVIKLIKLED
jgi:WD40 repeat protein